MYQQFEREFFKHSQRRKHESYIYASIALLGISVFLAFFNVWVGLAAFLIMLFSNVIFIVGYIEKERRKFNPFALFRAFRAQQIERDRELSYIYFNFNRRDFKKRIQINNDKKNLRKGELKLRSLIVLKIGRYSRHV